ncbi:S8 family serine peptidase, partial [Streptomyces sp. 7-21]|uniref:S8 family serine peptidase n=1 Tax=Streptomyces sp. 7-21 TaxID=2802283 RepID=UPI00191E2724|nr:S8 family serine peptidase [Streptomyces sp. 7-21]
MAALIAGTGAGGGIQGLAPGVDILPIRAYPGADEVDFGFERRFAEAVQYAADAGAQIISVSLATLYIAGSQEEVTEALEEAARQDILIFAGTGNDGATTNEVTFPNNQDGVVGVGAVD